MTANSVEPSLYEGLGALPHFNPNDDPDGGPVHPAVAELRAAIAAVDAVLFSTPGYAGALPGSFKNLLEWTVGGGETYGKPVAWVNASGPAAPTGAADAHDSLRRVLDYTGSDIVERPACASPWLGARSARRADRRPGDSRAGRRRPHCARSARRGSSR